MRASIGTPLCILPQKHVSRKTYYLLQLKRGGVAKAKGEGEKEKECTTACESQRRLDEMPPGHLLTGAGREEVLRKTGGEEARSVRCMCDVCAAHGDRAQRSRC